VFPVRHLWAGEVKRTKGRPIEARILTRGMRFGELHEWERPRAPAVALLHQWRGLPPLLNEAAGFYRMQLHRHAEAVAYLYQRGVRAPELIEHMQIGYAPGGCLRAGLMQLGYPLHSEPCGLCRGDHHQNESTRSPLTRNGR